MEQASMENPLREGLRLESTPEPCTIIIFGATGDLTKRKLVPALYSLARQNLLPGGFSILGTARRSLSHEEFQARMKEAVDQFFLSGPVDSSEWDNFAAGIFYIPTDIGNRKSLEPLGELLAQIDQERGTSANRLFYFSTPPDLYAPIAQMLGSVGLNCSQGWTRVIIEKPFGHDLESMRRLNQQILEVFSEEQVYRIDHYLGKETVQNIMVLRFSNGIFEPLWNRRYIDHVQITAAESLGVETRGGYYDHVGVLRDMIQNHLFQVFALVAMEPPASLEANAVRDEKTKVMRAVRPIAPQEVNQFAVRGQYAPGAVNGKAVKGYREEPDVSADSSTETYATVKLLVDNWRWAGVPFYLRSAKRLPKRVTEVAVQFHGAPHLLFQDAQPLKPNTLTLRIQPDEGITLRFGAKLPGQAFNIRNVNMDFRYGTSFGKRVPEAYERLLLDALLGDSTLFARGDTLEVSWKLLMPILEAWQKPATHFPNYEAGSWGPKESDEFMAREGRRWRRL
ncbi:glucose-6-phosphate dehydrogenase [Acidobacteria bacterium AH-259-D05]|nr:glucose-6-phosphate dehydrogenase [Acidobacteria bacterium AH-259-D05]